MAAKHLISQFTDGPACARSVRPSPYILFGPSIFPSLTSSFSLVTKETSSNRGPDRPHGLKPPAKRTLCSLGSRRRALHCTFPWRLVYVGGPDVASHQINVLTRSRRTQNPIRPETSRLSVTGFARLGSRGALGSTVPAASGCLCGHCSAAGNRRGTLRELGKLTVSSDEPSEGKR